MLRVGFVGWRGMVGSVLMERMLELGDFAGIEATFFTTSNVGGAGPANLGFDAGELRDAHDLEHLGAQDIIVSCQGGDYTRAVHSKLRKRWDGYWIDAASAIRMEPATVLALDPRALAVHRLPQRERRRHDGERDGHRQPVRETRIIGVA